MTQQPRIKRKSPDFGTFWDARKPQGNGGGSVGGAKFSLGSID